MKCSKCGNELNEGDLFCNKCGSKVEENNKFEVNTQEKPNNTSSVSNQRKELGSVILKKVLVGFACGLIFYFYLQIFNTPQTGKIVGFVYMFIMGLISTKYGIIILIVSSALYFLMGPWILVLCPIFALASAGEERKKEEDNANLAKKIADEMKNK